MKQELQMSSEKLIKVQTVHEHLKND